MKRGKSTDRGYMLVGGRLTDDYGLGQQSLTFL